MKITYDKISDAMYIYLKKFKKVAKTIEISDKVLIDIDKKGNLLGVEILDASSQISKKQILSTIKTGVPVSV